MPTHDRYEQDILRALKGIDSSLKKIADTLVPKNEKKQSDKENKTYYKMYCPRCMDIFTFDNTYPVEDFNTFTTSVTCPRCKRTVALPLNWKKECRVNEQDN